MRTRTATLLAVLCFSLASAHAQQNPTRNRAMTPYRLGLEEMRREAFDKAERAFQQAIDIDQTFEMAYYMLGRAQMPQKKYREAVASFSKARDLYETSAGRRFSNAQDAQHVRRERIEEIDEALRQLQQGPQTNQTLTYIRQLSEQKRLLQESMQRGTDMTLTTTVPPYISLSLGSAYFRSGRLLEAEREYKATIAADPKAGEAHNNLAVVYMETGRLDEAERAIQAAERAGLRVNPALKDEIKSRRKARSSIS